MLSGSQRDRIEETHKPQNEYTFGKLMDDLP